jgi:hypothetical protein
MYRSGQRKWKAGTWLMQDEESGKICYAKNLVRDYRGFFTRKSYADKEHPQDFVKGLNDPKPLPYSHSVYQSSHICNYSSVFVGNTSVTARRDGPADHLFEANGVGDMSIGCSFIIYPQDT